jgi:tripartite-type tricarboxylate transporter receptor subunit TctC
MDRRHFMRRTGALTLGPALAGLAHAQAQAQAQAYPGPVKVILPLQAASASDVAVRLMVERLAPRLGTSMVVENVAAAAGLVGLEQLSRARPDGRTVAALNNSIVTILPHLQPAKIKGEPRRDFLPVAGIANIPTFFAVPANSPVRTVQDLVKLAKAQPGKLNYSSGGVGSPQHLATEMFRSFTGTDLLHVPYRGASQAALAVASGEVQVMSMALTLAQPFLADGRVRLIGYCGIERHAQFRDLPTLREQGVKGYDYSSWVALFLAKDTPAEAMALLRREAQAVAEDRDFHVQLIRSGLEPWARTPAQVSRIIDEDFERWRKVIADAKIQGS